MTKLRLMQLSAWITRESRARRKESSSAVGSDRIAIVESLESRTLLSAGATDAASAAALDAGLYYWINDQRVPLLTVPTVAGSTAASASLSSSSAGVFGPVMPTTFATSQGGLRLWLTEQVYVGLEGASPDDVFTLANGFSSYERVTGTTNQYVATVVAGAAASLHAANALHTRAGIAFAHPNFLMEVEAASNDPLYPSQWNLHNTGQTGGTIDADIDAPEAWAITRGSADIVVAVLDVGVQLSHPDLVNNLFVNTGEIAGNGVDDDGNGWIDDVHGLDVSPDNRQTTVVEHDGDPSPGNAYDNHGTAVAGVIAAEGNNGIGLTGVAPGVKIMSIRLGVSNESGSFSITVAGMASAVYYVAGRTADGAGTWRGADVANHSYGTGSEIPALTEAFAWAATNGRGGLGLANFVSSGNGGGGSVSFPANLPTTIAVGATNHFGLRTSYSQYGSALDFVAPGGEGPNSGWIWTTDRTGSDGYVSGSYVGINGTSFSAPMAAGIAALMLSVDPTLTFDQIRQIMRDTADRNKVSGVAFDSNGFHLEYGYGWLNAHAAVVAAQSFNAKLATVEFDDLVFQRSDGAWIVAKSDGTSFVTQQWSNPTGNVVWGHHVTGDFNGDGLEDVAARNQQTGQWMVGISTGSGFTFQVWGAWAASKTWGQVLAGDFNGDGRMDIAGRIQDAGDGRWFVSISTGTGFQTSSWGSWTTTRQWGQASVGDFNGDGKADIAGRIQDTGDGRWFVSLSEGNKLSNPTHWLTWSTNVSWSEPLVGDFNGDGYADIAGRTLSAGDGRWFLGLSDGARFRNLQGENFAPGVALSHQFVGDFDGDGVVDIAARLANDGRWFVLRLAGTTFASQHWGTWSTESPWTHAAVGDFNGDGRTDIAARNEQNGSWQTALSIGSGFQSSLWGAVDQDAWRYIAGGAFA